MRGEYYIPLAPAKRARELPPRARRILGGGHCPVPPEGTTSACAENTTAERFEETLDRNYLRVRGEYRFLRRHQYIHWELPPRARRILPHRLFRMLSRGTTSACAENTLWFHHHQNRTRNYLRVRGEYAPRWAKSAFMRELPPRARRIPNLPSASNAWIRTTSACAENTLNELGLL